MRNVFSDADGVVSFRQRTIQPSLLSRITEVQWHIDKGDIVDGQRELYISTGHVLICRNKPIVVAMAIRGSSISNNNYTGLLRLLEMLVSIS